VIGFAKFVRDAMSPLFTLRELHRAKRNRANHSLLNGKRFYATEDRDRDRSAKAVQSAPRSCIRNQSLKISLKSKLSLKRQNIVLALPSYNRQRLSVIGRGWCPSRSLEDCRLKQKTWSERVIRSDVGEAHRLSLSARVLSAPCMQVKAKTTAAEALLTCFEKPLRDFQSIAKPLR
jgi:hypothetical protein